MIPVKKNEILEVEILDITEQAYGVAKVNDFTLFVEGTLPTEIVKVRVERLEKRFAFAKLLEILKESDNRVAEKDGVGTRIGTMPLQHMAYSAQLEFKKKLIENLLGRQIDLMDMEIKDTLGMEIPWEYRNKAQIPVRDVNGVLETGFFKRGSHDLIPIENFYIQDKDIDQAIVIIRNILREYKIIPYDEKNHTGCIRHVIVRKGHYTQELMVILVTNSDILPYTDNIVREILDKLPNTVSIIQNININKTNVIMGNQQKILFGEDVYYDTLLDNKFAISSRSFFQVNTLQTEVLYQSVIDMAKIEKHETVIDAYCGIGTIALSVAKNAKHIKGVEIVGDAIKMAKFNAKLNNINNSEFYAGKSEDLMMEWAKQGESTDVLIVDPPRKGLDTKFIEATLTVKPNRIVYVSCNPVTLARDLKQLVAGGYQVEEVQPVDMFPHTTHVETIVLMVSVPSK